MMTSNLSSGDSRACLTIARSRYIRDCHLEWGGVRVERKALLLTGSFGLGHEMLTRACTELLEQSGWQVRALDSVKLLGPRKGPLAEKAFARLVKVPGVYDGLHFAHLRTGSKLAELMDRASRASLEPALRAELDREPAELIWSVFSTGASARWSVGGSSFSRCWSSAGTR